MRTTIGIADVQPPHALEDRSVGGGVMRPENLAGGHDAFLDAANGP